MMINDQTLANELLAARHASGADRYDEVWEGIYMMTPMADNDHQRLVTELAIAFGSVIDWKQLGRTLAGANVSGHRENWTHDYRVPDLLVFLNDTAAVDCGTHWCGGPDFAVEIVSPGDRTLDKLDFYTSVATRELLVIDRNPWQLTLYRTRTGEKLSPVALSSPTVSSTVISEVIPIRLKVEPQQSAIQLAGADGKLIRNIPINN